MTENYKLSEDSAKKEKILKKAINEVIQTGMISKEINDSIENNGLKMSFNLLKGYLI